MSVWRCLLSYAWPVPLWQGKGKYGPLNLVWESGHLVVNSSKANQSYGNLHAVWQQCLADMKVAERNPSEVLILGFGAGSLAHILRREMGLIAPITGVDGDPEMLRLAKQYFKVDRFKDLMLITSDARDFLDHCQDRFALVLVDLCYELDLSPGIDEPPFIQGLRRCVAPGGLVCINTIAHDHASAVRSLKVGELLRKEFNTVDVRQYMGINKVWTAM